MTSAGIVAATSPLAGSSRVTDPSFWFSVQTPPSPAAKKRGWGPTRVVAATRLRRASSFCTTDLVGLVTHTAP
jgi:hypothetical protein